VLAKSRIFLNDVKAELKKVTWPARKETISTSWVVIVIILLISLYLGICDFILVKLLRVIIH
jgi:preprotein translocase subunit SecE